MTRLKIRADGETEFDQVFGLRPRYVELLTDTYRAVVEMVDPVLFELARLRLAEMLDCSFDLSLRYVPAQEAGLTEEKIAALPTYSDSPLYGEQERAWLDFVEMYVMQVSAISDEECDFVMRFIEPEEFALLTRALWAADTLQRACVVFGVAPTEKVPSQLPNFTLSPAFAAAS